MRKNEGALARKSKINPEDVKKTKYIGVVYHPKRKKYYAFLNFHGYNIYINSGKDIHDMARFYNNAACTYYEMTALLNIIGQPGKTETILQHNLREGDDEFMLENFFDKGLVNYYIDYNCEDSDSYA